MTTVLQNLPAPAKLNLFLHIVGRRPDGYHELESVFVLIDLADNLTIERLETPTFERTGDLTGPVEGDLTIRAAKLLAQKTQCPLGAKIHVTKRIPVGAGMGGGSSDAATTLIALNSLWNLNLSKKALAEIGLQLGADIPFFLFGGNAFAAGIGEELTEIHVPESPVAIVMPSVGTSTKAIYTAPDLKRNCEHVTPQVVQKAFDASWPALFGTNVMQAVAERINPQIQEALTILGPQSRMTGSGSAVFKILKDFEAEKDVFRCLPTSFRGYFAKILASHPLKSSPLG